jgi:hypothetical protein
VTGEARWHGQPGFFEIWFLVVVEPPRRRAWWLRYTTWAPAAGDARATLWAAAFDGDAPPLVRKSIHPITAYAPAAGSGARIGDAVVGPGFARGSIGDLAWDVAFEGATPSQGPAWLHRLPAPTQVEHLADGAPARGWMSRAGQRHEPQGARVIAKHIWGTRRVEELHWVWCPELEATSVRLRAGRGPALATVRCEGRGWDAPWQVLRSRVMPDGAGTLRVEASCATRRVRAVARCDPRTLAAWVYRDPAGWDVYVAQSDVASCDVELWTRAHPLRPWGAPRRRHAVQAAIEHHRREPLPGVRYLAWDEEGRA